MFCRPRPIFGDTEGVVSHFRVLRARTHFRRYRGRRVLFSCHALPNSFSAVLGRRVPFPCFSFPDIFSTVLRASNLVFMFCAPGLIFDGTVGVLSRIHILRAWTRFRRYQWCRVPFSCYALPDTFSAEPGRRSRFHVLRA
jgi:hypothetical protein